MGNRVRAVVRAVRAVVVLAPLILTFVRDGNRYVLFGGPRELSTGDHRERARRLTDAFERLGITYIKLAQFLTTRPDLMPPLYLDELARLQDDVKPEPFESVRRALEVELGPMDEVFDDFEEEPISGASIGQVHRAVVDGEEVAVKVRRPGIEAEMEADMLVISKLIPIAFWGLKRLGQHSHAESAKGITSSLDRTLREEMDFARERSIIDEIRGRVEADGLDDEIVIPDTYPEYSTERVLTMSYEDGVKITDLETIDEQGHDIEEIVDNVVEIYLRMPFVYQCFQADPHHGNLAVNEEGQVIIYDFGISERADDHIVDAFIRFFTGLGMENASIAVDAMIDMGAMDPAMDREALEAVIEAIIADISGGQLGEAEMAEVEQKVDRTLYDYPLKLNQEIVLAMRTTFGVEGLCAKVAPEYDFSAKLFQFFVEQDLFDQDLDPDADEAPAVNEAAIKKEIDAAARANGKRTLKAVFGGTMVVTGAVLFGTGVTTVGAAATGLIGGLSFLSVARSFGADDDAGGSSGPMFATRYNMEQWDDDERSTDAGATGPAGSDDEAADESGSTSTVPDRPNAEAVPDPSD